MGNYKLPTQLRASVRKYERRRRVMSTKKSAKSVTSRFSFRYAVKFLCTSNIPGTSQTTTSLLPGAYATVVNIYNHSREARFRMKLAVSTSTEIDPPLTSNFIKETLGPDQATKVDCSRISEFG